MYPILLNASIIISSIVLLVIVGITLRYRGFQEPLANRFILFTFFSALWFLLQGFFIANWYVIPGYAPYNRINHLLLLPLAILLLELTRVFLRLPSVPRIWWIIGSVTAVVLYIADYYYLPPTIQIGSGIIDTSRLIIGISALFWAVIVGNAAYPLLQEYRTRQQPLHRNRTAYWTLTLSIFIGGGIIFFLGQIFIHNILFILGVLLATYVVSTHRQLDIRLGIMQILSFVATTLATATIYAILYWGAQFVIQVQFGQTPLVAGIVMALILAIGFGPILLRIQKHIENLISGTNYDNSKTVREYSMTISNILNLDLLATVVMGLISEAMENKQGMLFIVTTDQKTTRAPVQSYTLRTIGGMGNTVSQSRAIAVSSPIMQYLSQQHHPLTQYDIDFHQRFRNMAPEEQEWFDNLEMDVFVPIYSKGKWSGLLALGPKSTGAPYSERDLNLLGTLADQTAVALENARLVEGLISVNNKLEQAYKNLNQAKHDLEQMDKAKTDFISIASHELRTPLTVIRGYSQMLLDDPTVSGNAYYQNIVSGINNGTERLHEIIERMLDVAKIDSRELDISPHPISISTVIRYACKEFATALEERKLALNVEDMTALPAIEADRVALQKVFYNLMVNAIKYTPDGGKIFIMGRALPTNSNGLPNGGIEVSIKDTGIGIDPQHHQLIFRKFYQTGELGLHSSGKTKFKGAGPGLGLAIAQGVILAHHGQIWVESPGHNEEAFPGSKFCIVLPLQQPEKAG